ncbi:MAG: winged helix DNA-binding protein [Gammaproteobacteria bacterium]|nr:winged helix DNA-binding protein [Gammaproteobacteria bacterium]
MALKTQDVLVLLKLVTERDESWTYRQLAAKLDLSSSQVHAAVRRIIRSGLALDENGHIRVHTRNLEEFLLHALRYLSVPERGPTSGREGTQ